MVRKLHLKWPTYTMSKRICTIEFCIIFSKREYDRVGLGTDGGDPKPDICLSQGAPDEVLVTYQYLLESVK